MSGQAETAAEDVSRLESVLQDMSAHQNARARPDVSPMSREELEDRFLRLYEESLLFKQHVNKQEDKIKKLGTKLMKLVKDRGRMEQLAAGGSQSVSKARNVEMEMMLEELQEKVRGLQTENEGLKQRLLVAKQQVMNSQSSMPRPYRHVQSRVNSGLKRREESPSPSHSRPGLVEEARARIRNLENVIESQQSHMEEMEAELEQLREELQTTQAAYEGRLQQAQQINKLRSHVNNNVAQIKLQKQLTEKSNAVTVLEGHLQEHKQTLKEAIQKLDELSEQLKHEKLKNGDLENRLQICTNKLELLPQQLSEVEQERDQLKESYNKLMDSIFDVSQQQKWQTQEQQLKLQIVQLETALKADLNDKNLILQKLKAEREIHEKLAGENKKLQIQFLDQKQEMDELRDRLKLHSRETEPHKERHDLSFLEHVEEGGSRSNTESRIQELQAAHAETILELEKTRHLLSTENKISNDYKAELEAVQQKMDSDKVSYEQKLEHKTQLLDTSTAKIKKLEAQLREIAYNPKAHVHRPDVTNEVGADESNETVHLEPGENLIELQIICASLSPSLLEALHDNEPYTFCTYGFYTSKLHSTPVVMGHRPQYGYTSKYVVSMDDGFQDYVSRGSVTVELHQALGTDWRTLASGQLPLQQLLKQDEKVHGTIQLVGSGAELGTVGSVDYWMRLRNPATDSGRGLQDKLKPGGFIGSAPNTPAQALPPLPKLKQETQAKDAVVSKKVTFGYPSPATQLVEDSSASHLGDKTTPSPVMKPVTPAPSKAEDDEDEFLLSAGQLLSSVSQSNSDVSEEISEDVEAAKQDPGESTQSDSDDCIVHGQATGRKASERVRVEVVSLSLRAESRVARDTSVMRLFVEYSLLDLPTEETPLSLPKPAQGRSINFNYSKVVPVDAESNAARRRLLREVLRGQRPQMERIRFTVVSEPPEEEEQDRECEDVGVAFLRIADILDRRQDLTEASLSVVDVLDSSEVVGSLTVSVEGLEALQAIMEDQDQDAASVSFLPLST